ncbi:YceI family protein [Pseudoruegeria sp. SK021]|uniref:YceI family protein n=1 Tax=Pseudoruegeria sp. SK021 TaxID=1933035 RepID=UPI000A259DB1|nr:YceI family protein [Pseudoruegeria sp. SK021]OSP54315.1 hypothetical protein BV911_13155 [Pseudoruegeria sp. SK021]
MRVSLTILATIAALFAGASAGAKPRAYLLDAEKSKVQFGYSMMGQTNTGTIPIDTAKLTLDLQNISNSTATVSLNADGTQAGVIFATNALKSASVFDTATYPTIVFHSTRFTPHGTGATVAGTLTLRGVTQPLVLDAQIYRQTGTDTGDLSRLSVLLTGTLNRSAFGATGYAESVADAVSLRILVRLTRAD